MYIRMSTNQALYSTLVWLVVLLVVFSLSNGSNTKINDIYCLKSIKESLEDPSGQLHSWNLEDHDYTTEVFVCNLSGISCWNLHDENRVREIRLSNMKFKGRFPLALGNCTYLEALDLSFNELSGSIPSDISAILPSAVTTLDLSHNRFWGKIPKHIADYPYLRVLKLNDNQFSGEIPPQLGLLTRLTTFSVANNRLAGPLPKFVSVNFSLDSYSNNLELCGAPLEPCKSNDLFENFKKGFSVGYEVSAIFVTTGFMCYYCFLSLQLKKSKKKVKLSRLRKNNQPREAYNLVKKLQQYEISELERWVTKMSFQEISNATKNFNKDNMIGLGKMGTMYKAVLQNGCSIAVKRLNESPNQDKKLIHEIRSLGRLRHNNLVPLLGFCTERRERILVYKYMSNGNLYDWLHPGVEDDDDHEVMMMKMEWPLRVKIAVGVARVLAWLHHNFNFSIVHLNINSNCILLDQNFEPKLSNFRGEMLIDPNRPGSRNIQVVNMEIWDSIIKKDVYSFGIVLLELITLREPSQMTGPCGSTTTPEDDLVEWVGRLLSSASAGIYQGIDTCLVGKGFDYEIFRMLRIASKCVQPLPDERPTMLQVYKKLRAVGERYGLTYNSGIAKQQPEDGIAETST